MPDPTPDDAPAPRARAAPSDSIRERRAAHSDADRDRARARLRVVQAEYDRVEPGYWKAVRERSAAAEHAFKVGLTAREIGGLLGGIPSGHVHRMRERERGGDPYAARRYARSQARASRNPDVKE